MLFFLQTRGPPVLPTVDRLRDVAGRVPSVRLSVRPSPFAPGSACAGVFSQGRFAPGDEDRAVVGGWDCSFPRDVASLEPSTNTESPCERAGTWGEIWGGFPGSRSLTSRSRRFATG